MFHIGERLKTVASMVPFCQTVADIGTDHAYLPIYLIKMNKIQYAIASDVRKGPLLNAKKTLKNIASPIKSTFDYLTDSKKFIQMKSMTLLSPVWVEKL